MTRQVLCPKRCGWESWIRGEIPDYCPSCGARIVHYRTSEVVPDREAVFVKADVLRKIADLLGDLTEPFGGRIDAAYNLATKALRESSHERPAPEARDFALLADWLRASCVYRENGSHPTCEVGSADCGYCRAADELERPAFDYQRVFNWACDPKRQRADEAFADSTIEQHVACLVEDVMANVEPEKQ